MAVPISDSIRTRLDDVMILCEFAHIFGWFAEIESAFRFKHGALNVSGSVRVDEVVVAVFVGESTFFEEIARWHKNGVCSSRLE